jgi:hypothetical protein
MSRYPILIFVVLMVSLTTAQTKSSTEVRRIDALAKSIDRVAKRSKKLVVADTANFDEDKTKWQLFDSEDALEKFRDKTETYTIAYSWKHSGRVIASNFTLFSPSGDWTKYVLHYFRTDGSVGLVRSELRTFYGEFIVKDDRYFDPRGRLIKRTRKYFDLTTGKPKRPTNEMREDNSSFYRVDYFKKAGDLPFAKLLAQPD